MLPALLLLAALAAAPAPEATAVRVEAPPRIDGDLSDLAWSQAQPIGALTQQAPDEGQQPSQPTEVRIVYDDHAIYFGIRCDDSEPGEIVAHLTRRDRETFSDAVLLDLDTRGSHEGAFHFEVTAAGVRRDALRTGDDSLNFDWDAVWDSAVQRDAHGWSAEIAIPLAALRFPDAPVSEWRMQLRRFIARRNETDQWVFIPRSEHGELLRYGAIRGLAGLPQPRRLELVPFALGRLRYRSSPPDSGLPRGFDWSGSAGLDARYGITSSLTLDATVLPDFGQVEADQVILNLTTFEIAFPEKRPFFLEGADLLQLQDAYGEPLGTQLFYSRRIGAPTPEATIPEGDSLISTAERIRILSAAKLSGRLGEHVSLGVLDGLTAPESATVASASGEHLEQRLAPLSNYAVARLQTNLVPDTSLGLTVTNVTRAEKSGALVFDGLCPSGAAPGWDGRCTRDATAAAIDAAWHSPDGSMVASAALMGSRISGGPPEPLPDGNVLYTGDADLGYRLELAKPAGKFRFDGVYEAYGPKLDLNDVGFLRQQNLHRLFARTAWREFDRGPTRETEFGLELFGRNAWDSNAAIARGVQLNNHTVWANSWETFLELQRFPRTFDNRETRDGALTERIDQYGVQFDLATNPTARLSGSLDGTLQTTWKGFALSASAAVVARPLSRLELSVGPTLDRVTGDPRWVETGDGPQGPAYRFGLQDASAPGATLRSTFSFTPDLTLQAYAQLFFASVRYQQVYEIAPRAGVRPTLYLADLQPVEADPAQYEDREAVLNVNVVFRWEYRPGSVLYVVYTRAQNGGQSPELVDASGRPLDRPRYDLASLGRGPTEDVLLVKASYFWAL